MKQQKMGINRFFTKVLGAKRKNPRWSWGGLDPRMQRVFLQVWRGDIKTVSGAKRVLVDWDKPSWKSPARTERHTHVTLVKNGAEGFGVVCTRTTSEREERGLIADFEKTFVLRLDLGDTITRNKCIYARIDRHVPIAEIFQERKRHAKRKKRT
jgi:hypothetical protein